MSKSVLLSSLVRLTEVEVVPWMLNLLVGERVANPNPFSRQLLRYAGLMLLSVRLCSGPSARTRRGQWGRKFLSLFLLKIGNRKQDPSFVILVFSALKYLL